MASEHTLARENQHAAASGGVTTRWATRTLRASVVAGIAFALTFGLTGLPALALINPPTTVSAAIDNGRVAIQWSTVALAATYNVYRGTSSGGETLYASGITTATAYSDGSATNGTTYYYEITSVTIALLESAKSTEVSGTPLAPYSTTEYRIRAGTATAATPYAGEAYSSGGSTTNTASTIDTTTAINSPAPAAVYQYERNGTFTYTPPQLKVGASYIVRLHFAESTYSAAGSRTFNVSINGTQVLTNFDIYANAGAQNRAIAREFVTTATSSGTILLSFAAGGAAVPKVDAIEIYAQPPAVGLSLAVSPTNAGPGTDITYTTTFTNSGFFPSTLNVITLPVASHTCFKYNSVNAAATLGTTGLTQTIAYSSDGGSTFVYTPVNTTASNTACSTTTGYDSNVTTVQWTLTGSLSATTTSSANTGSVSFTAHVK